MRIQNKDTLIEHGNKDGRRQVVQIMEAALTAADPYYNTRELIHCNNNILQVGDSRFEPENDPNSGVEAYDLSEYDHIYVVGAGKGVQRVAKAIEDVLGEHLTGGEVVAKHGDELILSKIHVNFGSHPVPDMGCVAGCKKIVELSGKVTERDIVFTIFGNGGSSLLTLPEDGIDIQEVIDLTYQMQIVRGISTEYLNIVRNHIDQLKGGKISRLFKNARQIHLVMTDANHHVYFMKRHNYDGLLKGNLWLHNLPESTTFQDAVNVLKKFDVWNICSESIRKHLLNGSAENETVKYDEFKNYSFRVFGIMPDSMHFLNAAERAAKELGYNCHILTDSIVAEASQVAKVYSAIAKNISQNNAPFEKPMVLLSTGEMLVTVGKNGGVGGRNQEFALSCAKEIDGFKNIVIGSADTDGTDGPGGLNIAGMPSCLGGGIVDGYTKEEAKRRGVDLDCALKTHSTSKALWDVDCGMCIEHNISLQDLTVILIQ